MNTENRIINFSKTISAHIKSKDMNSLKILLNSASEVDILDVMLDLSVDNQAIIFRLLTKDKALFIFERLDTSFQQKLIHSFTEESAIEIITALEPDERVRLFDEMPATFVKKMLSALSPSERDMTNLLMGYRAQTAGRIMTPEYVRVSRNMSVANALEKVKENAKEKETIYTIYITDDARKLEGVISLRDLWIADPTKKVEDVMQDIAATVTTDTDQEEVARLLQRLDWLAIPVVDMENRLVGIVTIDDAVDILEEEATEDILDAAGFADIAGKEADRSEVLTKGRIWKIWAVRLPFLIITLAAGMAAGLIIEGFEEVLESVVIVAFFIPLIMDMGGNVGTQSSTVFARGVVLGHINIKQFLKPFLKELGIGFTMGAMVGVISGGIITLWLGMPMLGIAVGIALVATMTLAAALGFLVPFTLMKLKVDQAAGSAPVITSIKDISGLFIYFALVALLMGAYLEPTYEVTGKYVTTGGFHFFVDLEEEEAIVLGREGYKIDIEIPEEIEIGDEVFPVTEIGDGAFRDNGLTSLVLPSTIIAVGDNAFRTNYLASIYLPASIEGIGDNAFRDNQLTHLTLYYEIEDFGDDTFRQNLLTEIVIPEWMTEVFEGTFRQNFLTSVIFHDGVEIIGEDAFMSNLLEEINLPNSLIEIEEDGFRDNLLTHVELPDSLQIIGYRAFMDNELVSIVIPSSVTEWIFHEETGQGDHFHNNKLEEIITDANNASVLAGVLTSEVMGDQTSRTTTIVEFRGDAGDSVYQRDNRSVSPVWARTE